MKIHEYNEMMAYLTRPAMKTGGQVIGKPGGLVEPGVTNYGAEMIIPKALEYAPKIPSYVQKAKNIYGKAKNIFNTFRNKNNLFIKDKPLIRKKLNEQLKDDLGYGINVDRVNKSGDIDFRLYITGREPKSSVNLPKLIAERDSFIQSKAEPLYKKGYVSGRELIETLKKKGISFKPVKEGVRSNLEKSTSRFANDYNIETIAADVPGTGGGKWYKMPSAERWEEIRKLRLKPDEKAAEIKPLIEELGITSHTELKKVMKAKGYSLFEEQKYNKYFPEIKGFSFTDPSFVHPGKKFNSQTVLNNIRYNLRKDMGSLKVEGFLQGAKKYEDYGDKVHLMHTTQKAKRTGETLDISDFSFGSKEENMNYARGLDDIRSGMTTTLNNISKMHAGKSPNTIVDVSLNLQKKYNFPKKMKLKDYVDRINIGLTDLAWKTNGKVRGELLDITGGSMQFVDNPVVNYGIIPGKGLIKGKIKDFEPIIKKIRMDPKTGNIILDKNGYPAVKKGQKLTQDDAETILMIWENIKSQLPGAKKAKPFTGDFKYNEGGRVGLAEGTSLWGKTKSVGGTTLRGLERASGPWMAPLVGLYTAITGNPPDPTAIENLFIPSFWNQIMKRYNWQDKSSDPIKRRIINAAKRGLIPTNLMPAISRATGIGTAVLAAKYVAEESQPNILQGKFDPEKADQVLPALIEGYEKKWMGKDESPYMDYSDAMLKMKDPDDLKATYIRNQMRENQNQGGRVGFGSGSTFDAHTKREAAFKAYKDYKKSYYSSRQRYPILTFRQFLPLYAAENYNQGGRVGLKEGSPKSPGRRAFIKGITALAALPIVGRLFKLGKVLERGSTYMGPAIQKIKGMPEWFPGLVKKLWNEGEDVTKQVAYGERQVVKRGTLEGGDDVDLVYQMDTGDVSIQVTPKKGKYETSSGAYNKEYSLEYKKGEVIDDVDVPRTGTIDSKTGHTKKLPDEFGVTELEGRMDPNAMDIDWDANYTTVDDAMSDLTEIEAFAKNKTTKQIHKKKGTKPKDVFPDYDPGDYDID